MPREAILFGIALISVVFANSYALTLGDVFLGPRLPAAGPDFVFDTGILKLDPGFFEPGDTKRYVIFGTGAPDAGHLQENPLYGVRSGGGFFYVATMPESAVPGLLSRGYHVIEDFELDFHQAGAAPADASRIGQLTGAAAAAAKYGVTGSGITVGIVDTGVDFSNPDIRQSLARDRFNHPLMLDPDGQGIVITNSTFFAFVDKDEIIRNYSKPVPEGFTSSVYQTKDGIFLDLNRDGQGTDIPIYNSFFPQVGQAPTFNGTLSSDMKIGDSNRDYIKSKSGVYHLGIIYQGALQGQYARVQVVPVLVVDSNVPGVYDTVIPDMSTSWEDYTRFDLDKGQKPDYDFDFTDERPIVLGSGNEFLVYDSDDDGRIDYSAGTVGARVLDVYSVVTNRTADIDDTLRAVNGTLLAPFDSDGNFFGVMTDFVGHGTSSAASIASQGQQTYDIYNNTEKHVLRGVAPGAKILPIKALWFGDTVYSWLWAAGFDNQERSWNFTGKPRADIISNSWGVSNFPSSGSAPGMDILSLIAAALATPAALDDDFRGVTVVSSAGNSGHGYGTLGMPNASPFGITVGATTNNVFVGYGPFDGQPRFGNSTSHHSHVVDFSSRGPSVVGDPKPDLMSIGAHGFIPSNMLKTEKESKDESFSLFGGTSMSAPLVSGSAAVLMEGLHDRQKTYDAFAIKNILMSTATDLKNDPFTQGSGMSNVEAALDFVHGKDGMFIVYNDASYHNIKKVLDPAISSVNSTRAGLEQFSLPPGPIPMTGWFAGRLSPGEYSAATFTVENPTGAPIEVTIRPQNLSLIKQDMLAGTTEARQQDPVLNKTDAFVPNYVKLSDVKLHRSLDEFFDEEKPIPPGTSLMILNVNFPFNDFMNKTDDTFANDIKISSLYLYDWIDSNNDTDVASDEISMISRAGSWGTVQELRISDPAQKFEGTPLVGIYPVPTRYSYWAGDTQKNSTSMNYTLSASYYQKDRWPVIWTDTESLVVPPNGVATLDVNLVVPSDFQTGAYQGFLTFEGQKHTVNTPVSFVVTQHVAGAGSTVVVPGKASGDVVFANGQIKGAFDMVNRYMAGDWRQYYFDIGDGSIDSGAVEISWQSDDTNLSVFVMDPAGRIVQTNMPSGVFGHFLGWPSLDWLGNSPFSQGGGFFPVKNKDDTSTVLLVPINQTGTYSILAHSTLFGGDSATEPISLVARFSDISAARDIPDKAATPPGGNDGGGGDDDDLPEETPDPGRDAGTPVPVYEDETRGMPEIVNDALSAGTQPADAPVESLIFNHGLALGVGVGVAVGLLSVFILRQRPQIK